MKRFVALCFVAVAFATAPAHAGLQEGLEAYLDGDYKTALREFQPLAEQGVAKAQHTLGLMYANGEGVPQDYNESIKWFRLSAGQGIALSQVNLGVRYAKGEGVPKDYAIAHMWFNISASNGSEWGEKLRDGIVSLMTPTQIEKAEDLARACIAKNYKGC